MVTQALYSIEFFDNERNLMPYCYFELYINGNLVTGLPPRADSHGKVWITRELVESMDGIPKMLSIRLWNSTFPKTQNSETEEFIWPEGKTSIKAFLPDVYTINTRPLANENNEEQSYQRAYYLVRKGDTWTKLEIELGSNTVEALMLHNRMSYADQLVEGAKLYYPLGFRTRNEVGSNTEKKPSEKKAQPSTGKKEPEKKPEQPKTVKEADKSKKKEEPKPSETKQESTIGQRSQANGKPEEVAKPKKDGCFCYRDFTVDEFKSIVKELRKGVLKHTKLWIPAHSSGAYPSDRTYEATVKELNRVMNKYEINTCLRKIHFLAQAYHETHFFQSTQEYDSPFTPSYDPYRGRGLIHLTHKENYENFSLDMNDSKIVDDESIVATDITYAFESGGWFWKKGARLSNNKPGLWRYPNTAPKRIHDRIKAEGANCSKSIVSYGNSKKTFGVLNLNVLADNDWGNTISWVVNGGANGFDERIKYRRLLKEIMRYEICKNKK